MGSIKTLFVTKIYHEDLSTGAKRRLLDDFARASRAIAQDGEHDYPGLSLPRGASEPRPLTAHFDQLQLSLGVSVPLLAAAAPFIVAALITQKIMQVLDTAVDVARAVASAGNERRDQAVLARLDG